MDIILLHHKQRPWSECKISRRRLWVLVPLPIESPACSLAWCVMYVSRQGNHSRRERANCSDNEVSPVSTDRNFWLSRQKKRNKINNALRGKICTFFNCAASIGSHNARNFSLFKHTDGDIPWAGPEWNIRFWRRGILHPPPLFCIPRPTAPAKDGFFVLGQLWTMNNNLCSWIVFWYFPIRSLGPAL